MLPLCYLLLKKLRISPHWLWMTGVALYAPDLTWLRDLVQYFPCFLAGVLAYRTSKNMDRSRMWPSGSVTAILVLTCAGYTLLAALVRALGGGWRYESISMTWDDWLCALAIGLT